MDQQNTTPQKQAELGYATRGASPAGPAPDIWISAVVGVVLLMLSGDFPSWLLATITGRTYDTGVVWTQGERQGQKVPYWQIQHYQALSESAVFAFGIALLAEAIAMFIAYKFPALARKALVGALVLTVTATLYNVVALVILFGDGQRPIVSLLAVAFGGYMILTQWRILRPAASLAA